MTRRSHLRVFALLSLLLSVPSFAVKNWPLPVPTDTSVGKMSDFRGALYRLGNEAIQIDRISWMISPSGNLMIHSLRGFRADGVEYVIEFGLGRNRPVDTLRDFHDFRLARGSDTFVVASIDWAIDSYGYLKIQAMGGTLAKRGDTFSFTADSSPTACALTVQQSCTNRSCVGLCGSAPMCACPATGGCDPITYTWCSGDCTNSRICNQSTTACGCIDPPPPPPPQPPTPGPPKQALELCPQELELDPITGNCGPGICWLCVY